MLVYILEFWNENGLCNYFLVLDQDDRKLGPNWEAGPKLNEIVQ